MSPTQSIVVAGLPGSGKTTYLAALWHVVNNSAEISSRLSIDTLRSGDVSYLNAIARRWRSAKVQDRTPLGPAKLISIDLKNDAGAVNRFTFPDLSGETFLAMWEARQIDLEVAQITRARTGLLLFIHADRFQRHRWLIDHNVLAAQLGVTPSAAPDVPTEWSPKESATQIQLIDVLQLLRDPSLQNTNAKLAVVLSAWDKAAATRLEPSAYLRRCMPLLAEYLDSEHPACRIFGLSAQGGDFEQPADSPIQWSLEEVNRLRDIENASNRIVVVDGAQVSNDPTIPLAWLLE